MLLEQIGFSFEVCVPDADEDVPEKNDFGATVRKNAESKVKSIIHRRKGMIILGADTIVDLDGVALGKPVDKDDARRMLNLLSGRDHQVHTGIALYDPAAEKLISSYETTKVFFRKLTDEEIEDYIDSGEPMDKAGSYGIQARGALFIRRIEGCFFNVMGLPLAKFWEMYKSIA